MASYHCEQNHSCSPDVNGRRVWLTVEYLWRHVDQRSTPLALNFRHEPCDNFLLGQLDALSKISQLDVASPINQNILQLDIFMDHILAVDVADALNQLLEEVLSDRLLDPLPLSNVAQQVSPHAELHKQKKMLVREFRLIMGRVHELIHSYDVFVAETFQNVRFVINLVFKPIVLCYFSFNAFYGHQFESQFVQTDIDLAEGTSA